MKSSNSSTIQSSLLRAAILLGPLLVSSPVCFGQAPGKAFAQGNVLNYLPPKKVAVKPGATVESALPIELRSGYHVNSNTPSDDYLIPLRLTWNPGPLESTDFAFPKAQMEKYSFSDKPLSVYSGAFEIVTRFKASPSAPAGPATLTGKLRYQACNSTMCLPPKTLDVSLQVEIVK